MNTPIISQLGLKANTLSGETVVITGAGGGIGYETARALLWLGANVVIAEINGTNGAQAEATLAAEFEPRRVGFVCTDVGDEASVQSLYQRSVQRFGKVDVVINNATIAVLGAVTDLPIEDWDASYRVNLRGPVLMALRIPTGHDRPKPWRVCLRVIHGHGIPWRIRDVQGCSGAPGQHARRGTGRHGRECIQHRPRVGSDANCQQRGRLSGSFDGHDRDGVLRTEQGRRVDARRSRNGIRRFYRFCRAIQGDGDFVHPGVESRGHQFRGKGGAGS